MTTRNNALSRDDSDVTVYYDLSEQFESFFFLLIDLTLLFQRQYMPMKCLAYQFV